ncbi:MULTISPECIES: ABC transporter permease [unclassified Sedimentibacter]|uniref:ABC transporter permease n=1 Tax=unclassified Sedimentibacter TaxID=2649220 RepID=UPI0027DF550C|nr:ABC transporter permease [Sedimentibacter sp. MB35-C1]WMJ77065.1 ABC transporter permease [Sedimentibacter sp. MB35-C1]
MKGLKYQLKNIRQDKLCILTFLLPIIVGLAISLLSGVSFSSINETAFYVVENDLSYDTTQWLQENGRITAFPDIVSLESAINNPSTQGIGVLQDGMGIKTLLSGDELQINTVIGNTLPDLYTERNNVDLSAITIIPTENNDDVLISLFIVITMVTAMFMGCTFNAMSIIGEKEDGISFINEVLPMTKKEYIIQKIALGFAGGVLSTILTAIVCIKITASQAMPLLLLIILSAFVAALVGLFIGYLSSGLMIGIIYIKVVMILFLAPPILFYLAVPSDSLLYALSYLLPSSATFYGLMDVLNGQPQRVGVNIIILFVHCFVWLLLFFVITHKKLK